MRSHYARNRQRLREQRAKKFANMRAAKERKRLERVTTPFDPAEGFPTPAFDARRSARSGFRVTITCLDDGERVVLESLRGPFGLTISPTLAGRKVACVLANYA